MDVESIKKLRTPMRTDFTKSLNKALEILETSEKDIGIIETQIVLLEQKYKELKKLDRKILTILQEDKTCTQKCFDLKYEAIIVYNDTFLETSTKLKRRLSVLEKPKLDESAKNSVENINAPRKFKLPELELKLFNRNIRDWLQWWGRFKKKNDEYLEIADDGKLQYLIQSTTKNSPARHLVESLPQSGKNYAVELKSHEVILTDTVKGYDDQLLYQYTPLEIHLLIGADIAGKLLSGEILTPAKFSLRGWEYTSFDQVESYLTETKTDPVFGLKWGNKDALSVDVRDSIILRQDLRKRFRSEYVGQLRHYEKKIRNSKPLEIRDVVLITSDNAKRLDWSLEKVIEHFTSPDGNIRLVILKTKNGEVLRPVLRLYPLEVSEHERVMCQKCDKPENFTCDETSELERYSVDKIESYEPTSCYGRRLKQIE
ncbi:integrase catalytic domain-containing protein [Nephila pilipes]|uniref:Integrase catalytic domain-containing protein n=1 Tax=Nephila pilipes TaxID=299642 RepID=A0A8X6MMP4_NEPPI|nr:integrase catalytic domain-containing protein [Nephila pilipes]